MSADVATGGKGWTIRPARADESGAVADLYLRVRRENVATIPPVVHDDQAVRDRFSTVLARGDAIWVAESGGELVGLIVLQQPDWIDQLYVRSEATGRGLGAAFVALARRELGDRLQLWTFQSNTGARRFYERLGFRAVETTDGDNEERAPDVRYLLTP